MQKRLLLAFVLSFLVLTLWSRLFPTETPRLSPAVSAKQAATSFTSTPSPSLSRPVAATRTQAPITEQMSEELTTLSTDIVKVTFSNIGGDIQGIELLKYGETLPVIDMINVAGFEQAVFKIENQTDEAVTYLYADDELTIRKRYELQSSYAINVQTEIYNKKMSNLNPFSFKIFRLDISRLDKKLAQGRDLSLLEYSSYLGDRIFAKGNFVKYAGRDEKFTLKTKKPEKLEEPIHWIGFRDRYFANIVSPDFQTTTLEIIPKNDSILDFIIQAPLEGSDDHTNFNFQIYYGPQSMESLEKAGHDFQKIMRFSGWGLMDGVAKLIYAILNFIHKVIPNWGVCIIILGILIYAVTYPLTLKSMASMKKMQAIQPKIAKLKEQYKNNPQKLSQEQMELFKEHKINPMGGCFPIIIQMPIFIGFYQVLWRSVMLKGADFLWIKDLSQPDRLLIFNTDLPLIGNEFNILPFLMGIIMYLQQTVSAKNMTITDPAQQSQQKMMKIFMPVLMVFIFYHAPSGLTLYFTFFYLLTTFTQWKISKTA